MKELCLDHFLNAARAAGMEDSEGEFTISHAQAVQKMASYSLPYPEAWILKIVQAAVIWEAAGIEVRQSKLYTIIEFCPLEKKNIPTEEEVVSTLLGQAGASTVPVGKLCLGLRSLVRLEDYSFILTLHTGRTETRPLYAGREGQSLTRLDRLRLARTKGAGIKIVVIHLREGEHLLGRLLYRFLPGLRRDRRIASELDKNAAVCSVPIRLNGRLLTDILQSGAYGFRRSRRPLIFSGVRAPDEPVLALAVNSRAECLSYGQPPKPREPAFAPAGENEFSAWYLFHGWEFSGRKVPETVSQQSHEVLWICNGVVVQCEKFWHPTRLLRLTVFLNANDLQTDITGLLLLENEEKEARWGSHLRLLQREFERHSKVAEKFLSPEDAASGGERILLQELLRQDFINLAELRSPEFKRETRPATRRPHSRLYDSYGLTRAESDKYVSELVRSKDGRSHIAINVK